MCVLHSVAYLDTATFVWYHPCKGNAYRPRVLRHARRGHIVVSCRSCRACAKGVYFHLSTHDYFCFGRHTIVLFHRLFTIPTRRQTSFGSSHLWVPVANRVVTFSDAS